MPSVPKCYDLYNRAIKFGDWVSLPADPITCEQKYAPVNELLPNNMIVVIDEKGKHITLNASSVCKNSNDGFDNGLIF